MDTREFDAENLAKHKERCDMIEQLARAEDENRLLKNELELFRTCVEQFGKLLYDTNNKILSEAHPMVVIELACARSEARPLDVTHTASDSWERLEEDASKEPCFYFGFEDKPCDDGAGCPANKLGNCSKLKAKDLIRRAKALAGVEVE